MLRAAFGVTGLQRTELAEHLAAWGQRRDCRISELGALLERLTPAAPSDPPTALPRFALTAPDARNEAVTQALRMISGPRATVVWLDDLQWADSALEWAAAQLGKPGPLIVATVQDEALVEAPTRSAVEALAERAGVTVYDVGPLAQDQWPALVQGLLGLSGELALRVEDRTRGNPLFATQLVGDWVSRGLMEPTPRGFRLRPGATVELPDSLGQIWQLRIERLLEGVDSSGRDAMMVAALLGDVVGQEEWQACCLEAEVRPGAAPVDRAMKAWLLHPATDGWQFVHGMFREALLQKVDPARLAELNHACARALVALADGLELSERVARHLLAGPSKRDALEPLWKGAMHRQRNRDLRGAGAILDERDALLVTLDVPPSDPAWPEGWVQRARLRCVTGDSAGSLPMLMRAVDHAREHGWNIWLARGAILAVGTLGFAGRVSEALALMQDLRVHLSADEDLGALADAHAMILIYQRRHDDALAVLNTALKRSLSPFTQLGLWNRVLGAHAFRGDLAAAQTAYGEVMKLAEQTGEAVSGANAEEAMGILYHLRADYERALTHYRSGQETMVKVGGRAPNLELNECLALTLLGRFDEVEPRLVAVEEVTPADYTSRWGYLVGMRTRIAAAQGDYSELEVLVARWETLIEAVDLVDSDLALFAESAAAEASERGLSEPADRLRLIAARQRAGLG